MKSDYEERKQNRIERYSELSEKAEKNSNQLHAESRAMTEHIPFGQPILVGHHSEKAHRNTLEKSWNKLGKAVHESEKSDYYANKAATAESNTAISSDDPEAVTKLKVKIKAAEKNHEFMKAVNKLIRKKSGPDIQGLKEMGLNESQINEILHPPYDYMKPGFESYQLSNSSANINRMKKRLLLLQQQNDDTTTETVYGEIRIVDNVEDNRLQIFFPGKPSETVRTFLKSNGFHWSRAVGAWQRMRSSRANYLSKEVIKIYKEGTE